MQEKENDCVINHLNDDDDYCGLTAATASPHTVLRTSSSLFRLLSLTYPFSLSPKQHTRPSLDSRCTVGAALFSTHSPQLPFAVSVAFLSFSLPLSTDLSCAPTVSSLTPG